MRAIALILAALTLASCTTSPTTGQPIFTGLVDTGQERQLGLAQQPEILKQFNGIADNQNLVAFVQQVGAKLTPFAERKDVTFTFTVLNDDIVNAFAVPGGYIYVTRGLLNIAQDESQVAAVLAHEMGHINARHSAQQMSQGMVANLGLSALGVFTGGSSAAQQLGGVGSELFLKGYSREHELEADALSVKYLAAAGYDPFANTKFLAMLDDYINLQAKIAGQTAAGSGIESYFATHPPTPERVARARVLAEQMPKIDNPIVNRAPYLRAIDGTVYGDAAEQGFARGREFIHPGLRFRFEVPEGFRIQNGAEQVVASDKNHAAILYDAGQGADNDPVNYLVSWMGANTGMTGQERINVNGFEGATAALSMQTKEGPADVRVVVLPAGNGRFHRLMFLTPQGRMGNYADVFRATTYSFSRLSDAEVERASPDRIRLIKVREGDSVQSLAAKMPVADYAPERFALINGITPTTALQSGETVKTIAAF